MEKLEIPGIWFPKIYEATKTQERINEITCFENLSKDTFKQKYASKSFPFILKNQFHPIAKEQTMQILLEKFGDFVVNVRFGDMSKPENYIKRRTADMPLKEFIENHFFNKQDNEIAYSGSSVITNDFLEQLKIDLPSFYPNDFYNAPRLWLGKKGTITHLHKDIPDNFAFNYFGTKKWIVFPPKDYPNLYMVNPNETEFPDFGASLVNLNEPDLNKFPNFIKAKPIEFILKSGDMLYLPAGWSHYVENTEDTLMINIWLKREKSPAVLGCDK